MVLSGLKEGFELTRTLGVLSSTLSSPHWVLLLAHIKKKQVKMLNTAAVKGLHRAAIVLTVGEPEPPLRFVR